MTTIIHGKLLAKKMTENLKKAREQFDFTPTLAIVYIEGDIPSEKYAFVKSKAGKDLSITVRLEKLDRNSTTENVVQKIKELNLDNDVDAIIVQLPLPEHIDREAVLREIDLKKDVDVLSPDARAKFAHEEFPVLPPIVSALQYILEAHNISALGKDVVVLGHGILVGAPLAQFMRHCGGRVTVIDRPVSDLASITKDADIIICGTGVPSLLLPSYVKEGVVIIDAGMKVVDGKLLGDAHPDVAIHSSLFTPTPNGMGPLVVSSLMKNVLILARNRRI